MIRRKRMRRLPVGWLVIGVIIIGALWVTWHNGTRVFKPETGGGAAEIVERFYKAEQAGDFGSAWELFHPLMQKRFDKAGYIQKRAHIVLQDFEVKTFEYEVGEPELVAGWRMDHETPEFAEAYRVVVKQLFRSPYGNFEIVQPCYAVEESGKWSMLWSYENASAVEESVSKD
ncbi:hypothetical protein [Paenibacillus spongiae]|uniref:Uncharacterized protein n=1 Tax=Paenibacillus spongiae TaxID=2909671 RepID=A0ABY5SCD8_9BACL|nr:hypothetical protein [Paenibacillus spongiae]UVI31627.1 hypothetical protein L1F29_07340 [Paenibacillus spongiae]